MPNLHIKIMKYVQEQYLTKYKTGKIKEQKEMRDITCSWIGIANIV